MSSSVMRTVATGVALVAVLGLAGCEKGDDLWFAGSLEDATRQAAERGDLVMVNFFTDW